MQQNQQIQQQQDKIGIAAIKKMLNNESIQKKFADMLGKKSAGFITSVINVCQNNSMLVNAEANSVVLAAASAAALDLPVNPNLGYAAIIPYYDSKKRCNVAQLQLQRNAWVELCMRTGQVVRIANEPVYEGELVSRNRFTDEYVFDETKRKSDTIVGYMAYAKLVNGFEKTVYWTVEECKAHGLRYSQTFKKGYGLWVENFSAMSLKSVLKHLIVKYLPKSIELNTAIERDNASMEGDIDNLTPVYIDNPQNKVSSSQQEDERVEFQEATIVVEPTDEELAQQQAEQQAQQDGTGDLFDNQQQEPREA